MKTLILKKLILGISLTLFVTTAFCQHKEWSAWIGNNGYLSFYTDTPQFVTANYSFNNGLAYADSASGEVNFIDVGYAVSDHNSAAIGDGMMQCGGDYQVVPFPSGENKFYLFHTFIPNTPGVVGLQTRCAVAGYYYHINDNRLYYSILDMDANGGLGAITKTNQILDFSYGGSLILVRHANGKDVWLLNAQGINKTSAYLIDSNGINKAVVSNTGTTSFVDASPVGDKIAGLAAGNNQIDLLSFDNSTGVLGNKRVISLPGGSGSQCFSPDGSKLYLMIYEYANCFSREYLAQLDLTNPFPEQTLFKVHSGYGGMKRALNGKIFLYGRDGSNNKVQYDALLYPNQPKNACAYNEGDLILDQYVNFPKQINDIIVQKVETPITNFNFPQTSYVCFGTYTLTAPSGYDSYKWNTGDTGRVFMATKPGNYSVLAYKNSITKPAAYGFTELKSSNLPLNLGGYKSACTSASISISLPKGFKNIVWNDNDTSSVKVITYPNKFYNYVVTATDVNGCAARDSFCVSFISPPEVNLGADTTLCNVRSYTVYPSLMEKLFPSNTNNYTWSTGTINNSITITQPGTYWCTGKTSEGCTASDTVNINFFNPKDLNLGRDTALCFGDSLQLKANVPYINYKWNTGETTSTITVKNSAIYTVNALVKGCSAMSSIKVIFGNIPPLSIGNDVTICRGQKARFQSNIDGAIYTWSTGSHEPSITVSESGLVSLKLYKDGCTSSDSAWVHILPSPFIHLMNDTIFCNKDSVLLHAYNPVVKSYLWQDGSTDSTFVTYNSGTFSVTVKGNNGCEYSDTATLKLLYIPKVTLGNDTTICWGEQILLRSSTNENYKWLWQDGSTEPTFKVVIEGLYTLKATNECGTFTDSLKVGSGFCKLLMPTAFTPNGDGVNDIFKIKYHNFIHDFKMSIYNRSGEVIFETNDALKGWDGTWHGKPQETGTYIWYISLTDYEGNKSANKGVVTLIR